MTDLLADPDNTLIATVTAPQDSDLYGEFAGQEVKFVVIACYPTTADNPRPDYPLNPPQTGRVVPHMQTGDRMRRYLRTTRLVIRWLRFRMATWAARSPPTTTFWRCPFAQVTVTL